MCTSPDFLHVTGTQSPQRVSMKLNKTCKLCDSQHPKYGFSFDYETVKKHGNLACFLKNISMLCAATPTVCCVSSISLSPVHELWVAFRLTSLDIGESVRVEREQPWEQSLRARLENVRETLQPLFWSESQKNMPSSIQLGQWSIKTVGRNR